MQFGPGADCLNNASPRPFAGFFTSTDDDSIDFDGNKIHITVNTFIRRYLPEHPMSNTHVDVDVDDDDDNRDGYRGKYHDGDDHPGDGLAPIKPQPKLPALLESLGLGKVTINDEIKVSYRNGSITASVKHANGVTQTARQTVRAGFKQATEFDPSTMASKDDRNDLIREEYRKGHTQTELAMIFGLSQSMIQKIVSG